MSEEEYGIEKVIKMRIFDIYFENNNIFCKVKTSFVKIVFSFDLENIFFTPRSFLAKIELTNKIIEIVIPKMKIIISNNPDIFMDFFKRNIKLRIDAISKKTLDKNYIRYYPCNNEEIKRMPAFIKKYVLLKTKTEKELDAEKVYKYELDKGYFNEIFSVNYNNCKCELYSWYMVKNFIKNEDKINFICKSCENFLETGIFKNSTLKHSLMNIKQIKILDNYFYINIYFDFLKMDRLNTYNKYLTGQMTNFENYENRYKFIINSFGFQKLVKVRIFDKVYEKNHFYFKIKFSFSNQVMIIFSKYDINTKRKNSTIIKDLIKLILVKYPDYLENFKLLKDCEKADGIYFSGNLMKNDIPFNKRFSDENKINKILTKLGNNFSNIIEYENRKFCISVFDICLDNCQLSCNNFYVDNTYCPFYILNDHNYFVNMISVPNRRFLCDSCLDFFCKSNMNFNNIYQNPHTLIYYFNNKAFIDQYLH